FLTRFERIPYVYIRRHHTLARFIRAGLGGEKSGTGECGNKCEKDRFHGIGSRGSEYRQFSPAGDANRANGRNEGKNGICSPFLPFRGKSINIAPLFEAFRALSSDG